MIIFWTSSQMSTINSSRLYVNSLEPNNFFSSNKHNSKFLINFEKHCISFLEPLTSNWCILSCLFVQHEWHYPCLACLGLSTTKACVLVKHISVLLNLQHSSSKISSNLQGVRFTSVVLYIFIFDIFFHLIGFLCAAWISHFAPFKL